MANTALLSPLHPLEPHANSPLTPHGLALRSPDTIPPPIIFDVRVCKLLHFDDPTVLDMPFLSHKSSCLRKEGDREERKEGREAKESDPSAGKGPIRHTALTLLQSRGQGAKSLSQQVQWVRGTDAPSPLASTPGRSVPSTSIPELSHQARGTGPCHYLHDVCVGGGGWFLPLPPQGAPTVGRT